MRDIKFTKQELALIEQLIEDHIEMLEDDAEANDDIKADLVEAESIHYKILKHFRDISRKFRDNRSN